MRFVHCCTCCEIPPNPPFAKGGTEIAPFSKGGRAQRGGIFVGHCANLVWSDLDIARLWQHVFREPLQRFHHFLMRHPTEVHLEEHVGEP